MTRTYNLNVVKTAYFKNSKKQNFNKNNKSSKSYF